MQRLRTQRAVIIALGGAVVAALAFPLSVGAFTVSKSTNGVVLERSSTDTQTVRVFVYYDYKGGSNWTGSFDPFSPASYNSSVMFGSATNLRLINTSEANSIEIVPPSNYRCFLVNITDDAITYGVDRFALMGEPLRVSVQNTPTVNVGTMPEVAVSSMPSVALESSVSVAGTMPVQLEAVPEWLEALAGLATAVMGFAVVSFIWGWRTR